jgi:hypothetical protein
MMDKTKIINGRAAYFLVWDLCYDLQMKGAGDLASRIHDALDCLLDDFDDEVNPEVIETVEDDD